MKDQKLRVGKKGGAKRVAKELTKIRQTPLSDKVFEIVEESLRQGPEKKSAKSRTDLEA